MLSPATVSWLGFFYGPGAGVLYLGAILTTLGYRLNAEAHGRIMDDLRARRGVVLADAAALKQ